MSGKVRFRVVLDVDEVMSRLLTGLTDRHLQTLRTCLRAIAEAALPSSPAGSDSSGLSGLSGTRSATHP
jgi:hypothetical protein